tara:strand:- start:1235 stop:2155 length:921 start_codon:yes stop_codon:yes gene_type:complete
MSIRVGLGLPALHFSSSQALWKWVDECENSLADSIWQNDRLISQEPFIESLSFMAALTGRTERIKFGMNVVVAPLRNPLVLAKQCASIDYLSNGRLLPAFGVGNAKALEFSRTDNKISHRGKWTNEVLDFLSKIWATDNVTYKGNFINYENITIEPKPVQNPLPIWIGGSSDATIERTIKYGTGWISGVQSPRQVKPVVEKIRQKALQYGKIIDEDHYGAGFSYRIGDWNDPIVQSVAKQFSRRFPNSDPKEFIAVGKESDIQARINEYIDVGISKFVLRPLVNSETELFNQTRELCKNIIPAVHN